MNLTTEEEAIVINYRKLSTSQKEAILASEWSFKTWLKDTVRWVWEKIAEYGIHEMIGSLFNYLRQQFF